MEKEKTNNKLPPCINVEKCKECLFRTLCMDEEELEMQRIQSMKDCAL